jgi:nitric oxide reductase NorD protein
MAYVTSRKNVDNEILLLFPIPFYTSSRIYYEEDLEQLGLDRVLDGVAEELRRTILGHARTLANVQPELAFHFLLNYPQLLQKIHVEDLGKWVSLALDIYDAQGLEPSRDFVLGLESHPDFQRHWGRGVAFQDVYGVLIHYLHALGREDVSLQDGSLHYTDIETIYVPDRVFVHSDEELNFSLYKIMVTHKFAQIRLGTYFLDMGKLKGLSLQLQEQYHKAFPPNLPSDLAYFLHLFPDTTLAGDLFLLGDTLRIERWFADYLPGLYRDLCKMKEILGSRRRSSQSLPPRSQVMEAVVSSFLTGSPCPAERSSRNLKFPSPLMGASPPEAGKGGGAPPEEGRAVVGQPVVDVSILETANRVRDLLLTCGTSAKSVENVAGVVAQAYAAFHILREPYQKIEKAPYIGELRPDEAERGRRRRRTSTRLKFRNELAKLVCDLPEPQEVRIEVPATEPEPLGSKTPQVHQLPNFMLNYLLLDGNPVPIPEAMHKIIEEIYEDLGSIPSSYLAVSDDMSGHYFRSLCSPADDVLPEHAQGTGYALPEQGENIHVLDEWDHRRQGYRKRWAVLRETTAPSGSLQFAEDTLAKYRGMVRQIKRQFERIRMGQTVLRRQKDGENVDLDAAVEAFSDRAAGLYPSEKVFIRLSRNKRDIAAAFLIDLSGSTSGWINDMERTALLILSEAMQVLQDRFAIYGFSGRTRRRCELFRIKGFDEPYGDTVRRRVASLRALEYTRLGPPIRHLTKLLSGVEAKTRLLITLSDGKPDDYDGYNGDYGIEDTRQALIEAKRKGIHPFCITIDKAEHSYLSRMYGAVNYVFIDDLAKLPVKIPEIYRKLTT